MLSRFANPNVFQHDLLLGNRTCGWPAHMFVCLLACVSQCVRACVCLNECACMCFPTLQIRGAGLWNTLCVCLHTSVFTLGVTVCCAHNMSRWLNICQSGFWPGAPSGTPSLSVFSERPPRSLAACASVWEQRGLSEQTLPLRVFQHIRAALVKFAGRALPPSLPLVPPALGNGTTSFSFQNEGNEAQAGRVSK